MVIPLRGIGGGQEGLGGGSPNEEELVKNLTKTRGLTWYLPRGFIVLSFLPFMKHLVAFLQGGWPPATSLQVSKEGPLLFQGKTDVSLAVLCCSSALSANPECTGHAFVSYLQSILQAFFLPEFSFQIHKYHQQVPHKSLKLHSG